jgi:hypothetical protein
MIITGIVQRLLDALYLLVGGEGFRFHGLYPIWQSS